MNKPEKKKVIVVGAGISGLSTAYYARNHDLDVTVLEASDRVGGRILNLEVDGDVVDAGAQFFHSNYKNIIQLLKDLGLYHRKVPITLTIQISRDDGTSFVTEGVFGIMRNLGLKGCLSLSLFFLRYVLLGKRFSLFTIEKHIEDYDNCTAADRLQGFDQRFIDFVARPVALAECMTTLEESNFYQFLNCFRLAASSTHFTLPGGMEEIVHELANQLNVRCNSPVKSLLTERGKVVGVELESGEKLPADHVVLTTTLDKTASIVPPEFREIRSFLGEFPHTQNPLIFFHLDCRLTDDIACYMSPPSADADFIMAIDHSNKVPTMVPGGNSIISAWSAYPMGDSLIDLPDDELIERAVADLEQYLPSFKHNIKKSSVTRHRWAVARYAPGTHSKIIDFKNRVNSIQGLSIVSNDLDGVHLETAVTSAREAAQRLATSR
ncbi:MAG: FAD-dependent oxidoreductase [Proteobacteria bacterium]|nr:FAD-dependent oxidoreductase [Pseudomonadota bacterium]